MPSKSKKKLLILSDKDFVGGSEVNYKFLIPEFYKADLDIHWLSSHYTGNVEKLIPNAYYSFQASLNEYHSISNLKTNRFSASSTIRNLSSFYKNVKKINRYIRDHQIDIVLSISMMSHLTLSWIKAPKKIAHIQDIVNRKKLMGFYGKALDYLVGRVDSVVLCSDFMKANYPSSLQKKLNTIYNPVDLSKDTIGQKDPHRIGMFARYTLWKGHHHFIDLAQEVIKKEPNAVFVAFGNVSAGNQEYFNELKQRITTLGLTDKVLLHQFTPNVKEEMAKCSAILHLSTSPEPFGRIITEAAALDIPVFGYNGGGADEIFEKFKITGHLVQYEEKEDLVDLILNRKSVPKTSIHLNQLKADFLAQQFLSLFKA